MTSTAPLLMPAAVPQPPLRVVVADDEPTALRRIARLLRELPGVTVVAECATGRDALAAVRTHRPDVAFLDIAMPGLDGLSVARRLAAESGPLVVFVTAYDEHAIAAFRIHAADYVLKPIDRARLHDAVEHARRQLLAARLAAGHVAPAAAASPRFTIRDGRRAHLVPIADILWVESFGNYARVHTPTSRYIHRETMQRLAEQLAPHGFVRVHRTAIANGARIVRVRPGGNGQYEACLDTGVRLRVSRTYRSALDGLLGGKNGD